MSKKRIIDLDKISIQKAKATLADQLFDENDCRINTIKEIWKLAVHKLEIDNMTSRTMIRVIMYGNGLTKTAINRIMNTKIIYQQQNYSFVALSSFNDWGNIRMIVMFLPSL